MTEWHPEDQAPINGSKCLNFLSQIFIGWPLQIEIWRGCFGHTDRSLAKTYQRRWPILEDMPWGGKVQTLPLCWSRRIWGYVGLSRSETQTQKRVVQQPSLACPVAQCSLRSFASEHCHLWLEKDCFEG